jgi:hypothetical protein
MSEPTTEQLTPFEQDMLRQLESREQRAGRALTPSVAQAFLRALRMSAPPSMDTAASEARRRDAASGRSTVDFLPPNLQEQPDVPLDRQYTEIEKRILEIDRETTLASKEGQEGYMKPPGKEVKRKKDSRKTMDINWAEYGWAEDKKNAVGSLLESKFNLRSQKQAERAMEVLLLAGYTADEVSAKLSRDLPQVPYGGGVWDSFATLFSDRPIPMSSLKVVFNEEMHADDRVFLSKDPENMEDLAWQLSWTGDQGGLAGKWMLDSSNPILEARGEETIVNGQKKFLGKYYVNEHNFIEWFRDQTNRLYDIHGPNGPINVLDDVKMSKGGFYQMTFRQMIEKGPLFKSEDQKTKYDQTWLQLQWEENMFSTLYTNDVTYRQASALGMEKWIEQYEQMTLMNPLTKTGFRTNMLQRLLTGSLEYREGRGDIYDAKYLSDNKLGGAFVEMVLAFYNLGDYKELERVLGKDSMYFTRKGWEEIVKFVAEDTATRPGGAVTMAPEVAAAFEKAFKGGSNTITDKKAFIEFLNLNTTNLPGGYHDLLVSRGMRLAVAKRYGINHNEAGMGLTEAQAWFFTRFMGGMARNDIGNNDKGPSPSVHDKMSEIINMNANRMKYAQGEGKPYGNLQTLGKHLAAGILPMLGIVTQQEVHVRDENGNPVLKKDGKPLMRRKSVLQVFEDLHNLRVKQESRVQALKRQLKERGLDEGSDEYKALVEQVENAQNRRYQEVVSRDATFRENAHREYTQVHLKPGHEWMKRIMSGKGIDLNDYNNYDAFGGVTVNREKFIKTVQSELIGTVRDMVRKYKWMNFNEDVRAPFFNPTTGKMEFRNCKLGMTQFGYDVLNREEFWRRDKNGKVIKRHGLAEIDFNKVEENRLTVMKQVFMTELAADFYNHQLNNSGDLRFKQAYYLNFIDALKTLSGKLVVDELAKHGITVTEDFMNDKDFDWLKERALNGKILFWDAGVFGFHLKWWLSSLWDKTDKDGMGFGRMFSIMAKEAFAGGLTA